MSSASEAGPYTGLRSSDTPHFQDPSCVEFTLQVKYFKHVETLSVWSLFIFTTIYSQDNLPEGTVQLITYGAPELSTILAMGLSGYFKVFFNKSLNTVLLKAT